MNYSKILATAALGILSACALPAQTDANSDLILAKYHKVHSVITGRIISSILH